MSRHRPRPRPGFAGLIALTLLIAVPVTAQTPMNPRSITKFVDPLPMPLRVDVTTTTPAAPLEISLNEFQQRLLPAAMYTNLPAPYNAGTYLWSYKAAGLPQTFPGPTLVAKVGVPTSVRYVNNLQGVGGTPPFLQSLITIDQTLHWADPLGQMGAMTPYAGPVAAVTHLHGGEVPSAYDGGPDAWWTPGFAQKGAAFVSDVYTYPNSQQAATLWYHDHTLGATRTNVYAGLAGFYLLRDPAQEPANLPGGPRDRALDVYGNPFEREVVIQDRMFDTNGQLFWPKAGINPTVHPFWAPEFFGDCILVNGKTWPFLNVEPRRYRFRLLNGSNARFYDLSFADAEGASGPGIWQIGSDGGLLDAAVQLQNPAQRVAQRAKLVMAPGERCDVIVDFSAYAGRTLLLKNTAPTPFPVGIAVNTRTTGQILQVRVGRRSRTAVPDSSFNPAVTGSILRPVRVERPVVPTSVKRLLTLNENMGALGPLEMYVNNTMFHMMPTENLQVGDTEVWEIVNLTVDTHPIHLHLLQFQLLNRQAIDGVGYSAAYGMPMPGMGPPMPYDVPTAATGMKLGGNPDVTPFLLGTARLPDVNERGWKDTFRMNPNEVTRVLVRVAPQDGAARANGMVMPGTNLFAFDPAATLGTTDAFGYPGGPGYVWHCHIVDHEDNDMMRPFTVTAGTPVMAPAAAWRAPAPASGVMLHRAEPNPARGETRLRFSLPDRRDVSLAVFDITGRAVVTLAAGQFAAGEYSFAWDGRDRDGRRLPEGTYWYRLRAGRDERVQRLVWMH
jgi:FtsP/CotA-like multicopper oxidase with cupredoxin domain